MCCYYFQHIQHDGVVQMSGGTEVESRDLVDSFN